MIRLQVNPAYRDLLGSNRLSGYAQIMQSGAGEIVEDNAERIVRRLHLDDQVFYLKRTKFEKARSAFESYARGRLAHSKPLREMLQFRYLRERGFDVAEVVACGEELRLGIPQRGFIITAEVGGRDLAEVYRDSNSDDRRLILGQFGTLLGRLHGQGFFGSTRLKDIIYSGRPEASPRLALIDRETRNPYPKRTTDKRVLDRLLFNIRRQAQQGEIFSLREWQEFCANYCTALDRTGITALPLQQRIVDSLKSGNRLRSDDS